MSRRFRILSALFMVMCMAVILFSSGTAFTVRAEDEPEKNGDIVILYTSDVHCGIDKGFGYAGLAAVRDYLISQGNDVILVDNGDSIQGEPVGTLTKGEAVIDLMNAVGYDIAVPGNHEFDYGMDHFLALTERAEFPYISCNFNKEGELVFEPYVIRELAGRKIAFVGVTTPETLITSSPQHFKDEEGNYIYGFMQDESGEAVYNAVQSAADAAREEGAEYVIVMAHCGNELECVPWTYEDIIVNTSGIDLFLDGHSHDSDQVRVKNKEGTEVQRCACGTKLSAIGWCRIAADGTLSSGLYTWNNSISAPELLGIRNEMSQKVADTEVQLNEKLNEVVASALVDLTIYDSVETDTSGQPIRMIRRAETNLGDLCADAYLDQSGADIAFITGGGIRASIGAGDVTLENIINVLPFGNEMCVIEVTGQQVLDALEWGARAIPGENGAFMQVAGMSYEIDAGIESPCASDVNGNFAGAEGERRVRNVLVNGDPLDPGKTYTLASNDYWVLWGGDGFTMFEGANVLQNCVKIDNQVLMDYITETLGGVIGEAYEDPYGQGRIVIVDE